MDTRFKVTAILKDFSEHFYEGYEGIIPAFNHQTPSEQFDRIRQLGVKLKIGNGSFRDAVDLNSLIKQPHTVISKVEPRWGYVLVTFQFAPESMQVAS